MSAKSPGELMIRGWDTNSVPFVLAAMLFCQAYGYWLGNAATVGPATDAQQNSLFHLGHRR